MALRPQILVLLAAGCAGNPAEGPPDAGPGDVGPWFERMEVPVLGDDPPNLFDVWGSSPSDVFVVGENTTVLHYDGASWTRPYTHPSTITPHLFGVWGAASDDVYAVGTGGTILHYAHEIGTATTGSTARWSIEPSGVSTDLHAVHGANASYVWAVGREGTVLFRDPAAGWTQVDAGTAETLNGVWFGRAGFEGVAVGNLGLILRYREKRWRRERLPGLTSSLRHVGGPSLERLFIVGLAGTFLRTTQSGDWQQVDGAPSVFLRDLWVTSSSVTYAVGWHGAIVRTEGDELLELFGFTEHRLEGVWGTEDAVFAVGVSGTVLEGP